MGPPADADDELVDALSETTFVIMALLNKIGADHDLSLTQLRVLAILRDRRLRMSDLATYLGLERSTMSGLVERAERRGLMGRAAGEPDRRSVEVFLTDGGREFAEQVAARVREALDHRITRLGVRDRIRLAELLQSFLR